MKTKTIFWNVDTQYDFMRPDGKLYVAGAETIEGNLEKLTTLGVKKGIRVVNTADWHNEKSQEIAFAPAVPDFKTTFPPHCMENTPGAEYVAATKPEDPYVINWTDKKIDKRKVESSRNLLIRKDAFDVFTGNALTGDLLQTINPDNVVVYGVATNVCVDFAVRGLLERGKQVYVVEDAIKELPHLPLEETVGKWRDLGATFVKTDDVAKYVK